METANALVRVDGRLVGTRLTVWDVLHYVEGGWSYEQIAPWLPLTREQFDAAIAFINGNREFVERNQAQIEERHRRGNPPEVAHRLEESRRRLEERRRDRRKPRLSGGDSGNAAEGAAG